MNITGEVQPPTYNYTMWVTSNLDFISILVLFYN